MILSNNKIAFEELIKGAENWNKWRLENTDTDKHFCFSDVEISNLDLKGVNLQSRIELVDIRQFNFLNVNFKNTDLSDSNLEGVNFTFSNLSYAIFNNCNLSRSELNSIKSLCTSFSYADLSYSYICNANFNKCNLDHTRLSNVIFDGSSLIEIFLSYSEIINTSFEDAQLINVDVTNSIIRNVCLTGSRIKRLEGQPDIVEKIACDYLDVGEREDTVFLTFETKKEKQELEKYIQKGCIEDLYRKRHKETKTYKQMEDIGLFI